MFLSFNSTGELYDAIGRFHFYFTGRDEIVRQQLGFDFTGRGRIAGITFHGTFFIVANVKFVANGGHAFYAFRHFHGGFSLRLAFYKAAQGDDFLIGFDRNIGAFNIVMVYQRSFYFRSDGAVIHEVTDFIHRAIDFLPCGFGSALRLVRCCVFCKGRTCRNSRGQHYGQQSFRNLQSCHSHRFCPV
ncbi:Uncharacterised protein [Salmonella enterica subsp. enterica serovar Bovismorbificans]|nr:Uncharacterised protein [Salmonella enterica subsp. enterica serovar Bovismorbificans]